MKMISQARAMTTRFPSVRLILPLLLSVLLITTALAQDYAFKVIVNKGSNQFRSRANMKWQAVSAGSTFQKNDELKTVENAYLGLIHSSGRTLEFRKKGIFNVLDLEASLQKRKKGLPSRYTDFVIEKILITETDTGNDIQSRGENEIQLLIPKLFEVFNSEFVLAWKPPDGMEDSNYLIQIMDWFGEPVFQVSTDDTRTIIDLNRSEFRGQDQDLVIIVYLEASPDIKSAEYALTAISDERKANLNIELNSYSAGFDDESPMDQILLAAFFETNDLIVDATYYYHKAMDLALEVEDIRNLYLNFLRRNNLD